MEPWPAIAGELSRLTGLKFSPGPPDQRVAGGSINRCYRWPTGSGPVFVKVAASVAASMLEAEADGLAELASAHAVRRDLPGVPLTWRTESSDPWSWPIG